MARTRSTPPPAGPKPAAPSPFLAAAQALFAQATAYANALGIGTGDTSVLTFLPFLNAGVAAADLIQWFKDFADRLKGEGRTFYGEDTAGHMSGSSLAIYLDGRWHGKTRGDAVTTTADDVRLFIQHLRFLEAAQWAEIRAGNLTYETSDLPKNIEVKIKAAGLAPTGGA